MRSDQRSKQHCRVVKSLSLNPRLWENQRSKNKCVCYKMAMTETLFIDRIKWNLLSRSFPLSFCLYLGLINIIWAMCLSQAYLETGTLVCLRIVYVYLGNAVICYALIYQDLMHNNFHSPKVSSSSSSSVSRLRGMRLLRPPRIFL